MAASKNPYVRYQVINACFTNKQKPYWTKQELIEKLEAYDFIVSARTLDLDLETMRHDERLGFHAPIAFSHKARAYHYTDARYTINSQQLSDQQISAFSAIVDLLEQFRGSRLVQEFEGAIDKLVRGVDMQRRKQGHGTPRMQLEYAPYYTGMGHFDTLMQALDARQCLRITYRKFTADKAEDHVFHPYFLKEFKGRWYALGHSEKREQIIVLALDRMEKITPATVNFRENKTLKPKEYFQHTLGVTLGTGPVEDIELWFSPVMAPYLKTQHVHHSQKTVRDDARGLVIALRLIPNPELTQLILGYGPDAAVLKPVHLKNEIERLWQKAAGIPTKPEKKIP
jgi:predicted DNA-binding transcriptional regulator YafY